MHQTPPTVKQIEQKRNPLSVHINSNVAKQKKINKKAQQKRNQIVKLQTNDTS